MLTLAGARISADHALTHLRDYAQAVPATIRYYDYGGHLDHFPKPSNGVEMADIARLVVINAELRANDVEALLRPVPDHLWDAVPPEFHFEVLPDNPLGHEVYEGLVSLYDAYAERDGLGTTKVSKLLHLKRPYLVPILDSVAQRAYEGQAKALAAEFGQGKALYWAAMWREARANAPTVDGLRSRLAAHGPDAQRLAAVAPLRLHDVLVWAHFHRPQGCPLG